MPRERFREALAEARERVLPGLHRHMQGSQGSADADDLVDDACAYVLERWLHGEFVFQGADALCDYLSKVCSDRLVDDERRSNRTRARTAEDVTLDELPGTASSPDDIAAGEEEAQAMQQAMQSLEATDQNVIRARYWLGLEGRALGRWLGVSASAACHRVQRALGRLRRLLRIARRRG